MRWKSPRTSLVRAFEFAANPSAPAYEPQLWNDSDKKTLEATDRWHEAFPEVAGAFRKNKIDTCFNSMALMVRSNSGPALSQSLNIPEDRISACRDYVVSLQSVLLSTNCYAYAMNKPHGFGAGDKVWPGYLAGMAKPSRLFKSALLGGLVADGFEIAEDETRPEPGRYLVYLLLKHEDCQITDFHFVRQDRDGSFSHKSGHNFVTDRDMAGNRIYNPYRADFYPYVIDTALWRPVDAPLMPSL